MENEGKINISLKDSPSAQVSIKGLNGFQALNALGVDEKESIAAIKVNGKIKDLSEPIVSPSEIEPVYIDPLEGLEIMRHSAAHVMAQAVQELFPGTKVTIGPAIKDGFYYDFDYKRPFEIKDLPLIEKKMTEIIKKDFSFSRSEISSPEAIEFFKSNGEDYKTELIEDLSEETVSYINRVISRTCAAGPIFAQQDK